MKAIKDEPDMQDTTGDKGGTHKRYTPVDLFTIKGRMANKNLYIQQLCIDTGYSLEDL